MKEKDWLVFQLPELLAKAERGEVRFHEFLRTPSLSCSIYHLPAGSKEMQRAHEEDELYLVLEGRARLRVEEDEHAVERGTLMYVRAACDHAFFDIDEDLTVLPKGPAESPAESAPKPGLPGLEREASCTVRTSLAPVSLP